jgi:hypothetical protein
MKTENEKFILDEGSKMDSGGDKGSKRFCWINLRKISVSSLSVHVEMKLDIGGSCRVLNGSDVCGGSLQTDGQFWLGMCTFDSFWYLCCM